MTAVRRLTPHCVGAAFAALAGLSLASAAPTTKPPVASAKPRPIDVPMLQREIAAHNGKVVVVNLWATWCSGCVEEFPDLVRLYNTDKSQGMELVTISFDDMANIPKAASFLAKNKLTTGTFVNRKGSQLDDSYPHFFEPKLAEDAPYGIPRTYIYDRKGKLVKTFVGQQTYATFQAALQPILRAK